MITPLAFPLEPTPIHEAAINAYEHYQVGVAGVPVHFMRNPGRGLRPIPLILTHGWPWTFWHWSKVIDPLADPAAFGGDPASSTWTTARRRTWPCICSTAPPWPTG